jgi:hypothetical protein
LASDFNNGSQITPSTSFGDYNNLNFVIQQLLAKVQTSLPVKVVACSNSGGVSQVGFVDVVPMVDQVAADGTSVPHATIFNLPYSRVQGGTNAIIIDPQVGDIGVAVFASRDISRVKNTRASGLPGSYRKYSFSDGMYLFGIINNAPTQYIQFVSGGIVIHSPTAVTVEAPVATINATTSATVTTPTMTVNGALTVNGLTTINGGMAQTGAGNNANFAGSITVTGDVTASGKSLATHKHGGVTVGGGQTGTPV